METNKPNNNYVIDWEKLIKKEKKLTKKRSKIKGAKATNKIKMGKKLNAVNSSPSPNGLDLVKCQLILGQSEAVHNHPLEAPYDSVVDEPQLIPSR